MRSSRIAMILALAANAFAAERVVAQVADSWFELRGSEDIAGETSVLAVETAVDPKEIAGDAEIDGADLALRRTSVETDPFEPLGIRAGSFILYPSLETTVGYTTNGTNSAGGPESGFASVTPEALIKSDWARHETTFLFRGTYETFTDGSIDDEPTATIAATTRLDLAEEWVADFSGGYQYQQQSLSDPNYPAGVDNPPGVRGLTSSAGLRGRFGLNVFEVDSFVDRTIYENGTSGGVVVDQSDRNNTEIGGRLRYGIAMTPMTTPFVEGEVARRVYDQKVDDDGVERSSWNYGLRAGLSYSADPVLRGELAIGYAISELDDPGLSALEALTFDGSLAWSPTELTTIAAAVSTSLDPSTDPDSAGSVIYDASLDIAYAWRRNVTVDGLAGIQYERFEGTGLTETTYRLGLGATWKINRMAHLSGGYLHEWLDGSDSTDDYVSDSVHLTLRLQR